MKFYCQVSNLIKFIFFFFSLHIISAQPTLEGNAKRLKINVVAITVQSYDDPSPRTGFGFITGENQNVLAIITAAHNIFGDEYIQTQPNAPTKIQVSFFSGEKMEAVYIKHWKKEDLALLEVQKPVKFHWQKKSLGLKAIPRQQITFIGRNQEWQVPAAGFITRIDNDIIYADNSYIEPGTSGAPLLNRMGIIGMIVRDDIQRCEAISLSLIHRLLRSEGPYYYNLDSSNDAFNSSSGDVIVSSGLGVTRFGVPALGFEPYSRPINSSPGIWGQVNLMITRNFGLSVSHEKYKINKDIQFDFSPDIWNRHILNSTFTKFFLIANQTILPGRLDLYATGGYVVSKHDYEFYFYTRDYDLFLFNQDLEQIFTHESADWRAALGLRLNLTRHLLLKLSFESGFGKNPLVYGSYEGKINYRNQAFAGLSFKL